MIKEHRFTNADASTILLIDDHPMLRNGIKQLLNTRKHLTVVAEANNGLQGMEYAIDYEPDLILLDINMPELDGLKTLKLLRDKHITSKIIIFTVSNYDEDVSKAIKLGADGYLLKDMEPEELLASIENACLGKTVISPELTSILVGNLREKKQEKLTNVTIDVLSTREQEILKNIATGLSNKMIANKLFISESTVKVHVKSILKKLQLRSRVEAAVWMHQEKIRLE
ncbi:two-component system response regulator NarL [Vibrio cholerae]|uniref:two-component system response regulator NarL n=1 Tax=Vibrio cholerae TaxID=666 RepID=UPI0011D7F414|nr:two-component system response regulator NarL [Vibrio cholerae]EGR0491186.1 two-component system response regulator NarL [Vibrio cholerae]ELH8889520.1 two-component system response regulator NarL [Vibrio cholerae]MDV2351065.1 two-component system response regulator NarL [Vibrio cholerae]TXY09103.1 two-component system response regulator NarL [Vibrio cholerae]GHY40759.1 transcriptional regulator NarL [Vibrio cholerae]